MCSGIVLVRAGVGEVVFLIPSSICDLLFRLSTSFNLLALSAGGTGAVMAFLCKDDLDPGELDRDVVDRLSLGAGTGVI